MIDITRHQHGWKEFIAPWDKYEQHRVQFVDDRGGFPFMQHAKQTTELESLNEVLEHSRLKADKAGGKNHARPAIPVCLTRSLESHIDEKFGGLQALLETKDDVFREGQETIIAAARRWLRNGITSFKRRQDYRYYISPDTKSLEISVGLEFSKKLKNVWFSNEEYEKHIHSPKTLQEIWKKRWDIVMEVLFLLKLRTLDFTHLFDVRHKTESERGGIFTCVWNLGGKTWSRYNGNL